MYENENKNLKCEIEDLRVLTSQQNHTLSKQKEDISRLYAENTYIKNENVSFNIIYRIR